MERAVYELYGVERAARDLRVAGGTDRALARTLLARAGAHEGAIDRVLASYIKHLAIVVESRRYRPIGDVMGAVAALRTEGAIVGVATGNVREGAQIKLASAGLTAAFDLTLGGFGCDAEPRADILRKALERCGADAGSDVVVVGDTDRDVLAGRAVGARVIGVAVDDASRLELSTAGADAIVPSCGEALVARILE